MMQNPVEDFGDFEDGVVGHRFRILPESLEIFRLQ
jgi:hypothetical protein